MLEFKKGVDILSTVGGVTSINEARKLFEQRLDNEHRGRLAMIKNEEALLKVANAIAMCDPDQVYIHTGSEEDCATVRRMSLEKGEEKPLALPGHTIHFDLPEDQGRMVDQTFYIVNDDEQVSSLAKKELRETSHAYIRDTMRGIMRGKTMFVGFYSRGPVGAQASIPAIEISSSTYVMHSAELLYRNCFADFDAEVARRGEFFTNVHSEGTNRSEDVPRARIYMDRSWQTTFSFLCTYAGNTLLMKKGNHRFASDCAMYKRNGEELSEHMFITGMTGPGGRKTYFAGAAPSGCGKTTTAMVGSDFIGDDLAQMWIEHDGTLRAVNPEIGIFGIIEDVNQDGDPYLMKCLRQPGAEVIFSNVLIDEQGKPRWTGDGEPLAESGVNFQGKWTKDMTGVPMSHPNSRCTLRAETVGNHNRAANADPKGLVIEVITYSGRDSNTMPPIWVAKNMDAGVAIGASIVSKATAAEIGASGVNRQPWANTPFVAGPLTDYLDAQLAFYGNPKMTRKPVMAGLNYFLTHEARGGSGTGLLGEKRDVHVWLGWLELYAHGDVQAIETPIGLIPQYQDLKKLFTDKINKEYPESLYTMQFSLYIDNVVARIDLQEAAWRKEQGASERLFAVYAEQKAGLLALKAAKGGIVKPQDL
ncbi:Phosphoenolpyruvate carboxykinase (GTP) [Desulfobulbus propionicus DSM 2032]|uniref:Phosphoenolpyruvate carboxykinase [GTP] n=1 Tax=Desulfobulbus propionicus (strain ATCC 33891 / DSM 2032 / VKM B-1956 / 1pr3) TaxID=577650 RepID=A0A7U3YPW5_DESPD|nr:phosphoenolpyruvate carboxykinase (GTP) [Desulfobulbus propionicus]ADW19382.1 Phosphoenolpyruvate carboxykinase (GTP) [Desulfobulbus propionicus DSM 2032]